MNDQMDALLIRPGKEPEKIRIRDELTELQKAVGGYIEVVMPYEDPVCIVCNEEGKLNGMELNRSLRDEEGNTIDTLAGPFLVIGAGNECDFCSLTDELSAKYEELFHEPEQFRDLYGDDLLL